jgi:hypothetical protein
LIFRALEVQKCKSQLENFQMASTKLLNLIGQPANFLGTRHYMLLKYLLHCALLSFADPGPI